MTLNWIMIMRDGVRRFGVLGSLFKSDMPGWSELDGNWLSGLFVYLRMIPRLALLLVYIGWIWNTYAVYFEQRFFTIRSQPKDYRVLTVRNLPFHHVTGGSTQHGRTLAGHLYIRRLHAFIQIVLHEDCRHTCLYT